MAGEPAKSGGASSLDAVVHLRAMACWPAPIAVVGTGVFLLAVAAGLAEAGADVVGVFEAGGTPLTLARHPITLARNAAR